MYARCGAITLHIQGGSQPCEGMASLVRRISERCPNIVRQLISARGGAKRFLNVGCKGASTKWSSVRSNAVSMLHPCVMSYTRAVADVCNIAGRWGVPPLGLCSFQ